MRRYVSNDQDWEQVDDEDCWGVNHTEPEAQIQGKIETILHTWGEEQPEKVSSHSISHGIMHIENDDITDMEWLRLVGSLKLWVSFAKEACKRDYILQKRPRILRSLLIVATPYHMISLILYMDDLTDSLQYKTRIYLFL